MVSAIDRFQAAWDLMAPQRRAAEQLLGLAGSPFQIQSAVARLLRARDVAVPPGVGR